jgi:hypothetical protein
MGFASLSDKITKKTWNEALEQAAVLAESDVDWTRFGKPETYQFEDGPDSIREYRIGIAAGRAIAVNIRRMKTPTPHNGE